MSACFKNIGERRWAAARRLSGTPSVGRSGPARRDGHRRRGLDAAGLGLWRVVSAALAVPQPLGSGQTCAPHAYQRPNRREPGGWAGDSLRRAWPAAAGWAIGARAAQAAAAYTAAWLLAAACRWWRNIAAWLLAAMADRVALSAGVWRTPPSPS